MDTTVVGYEWSALRSLIAKSLEQGSEVVLKILILKKISLKCVCVIFLVLAIEFLCRTTRTRVTLAVQSGAAILGAIKQIWGQSYFRKMTNPVMPTAA